MVAFKSELTRLNEELNFSKRSKSGFSDNRFPSAARLKRNERNEDVSSLLYEVLSSWFGKSNPRPVVRCITDEKNSSSCFVQPATSDDKKEMMSSTILLEEAISRVIVGKIQSVLNCSFSSSGDDRCGFRPGPPGTDGQTGEKGNRGQRGKKATPGRVGDKGSPGILYNCMRLKIIIIIVKCSNTPYQFQTCASPSQVSLVWTVEMVGKELRVTQVLQD